MPKKSTPLESEVRREGFLASSSSLVAAPACVPLRVLHPCPMSASSSSSSSSSAAVAVLPGFSREERAALQWALDRKEREPIKACVLVCVRLFVRARVQVCSVFCFCVCGPSPETTENMQAGLAPNFWQTFHSQWVYKSTSQ